MDQQLDIRDERRGTKPEMHPIINASGCIEKWDGTWIEREHDGRLVSLRPKGARQRANDIRQPTSFGERLSL
jgi:hypothetical protein